MTEKNDLAARFEADRARLSALAFRMLGSRAEADDAVQEAWLRLERAESGALRNFNAWLTTIVARICLDVLRSRKARREEPIGPDVEIRAGEADAERDSEMADSIGVAMLVVLETLAPAERVAFVLHDMFNLPFEDIAPIVERSPAAARQLASRARRRVQGGAKEPTADQARRREVVNAFLAAARAGDFSALLAVLDPDVVLRADAAAVEASLARAALGAPQLAPDVRGAEAVAEIFKGRAGAARPALIDGFPGMVFAPGGKPFSVFDFVIEHGRIVELAVIVDQATIARMDLDLR